MIAVSPHCSVYFFPYIPYCVLSFIEHWLLFYKSMLLVITRSSGILSRCCTVSNNVFFGRTKSYLGGNRPFLRGLTKGVIIVAEIVCISVENCCIFSHPRSAYVYLQ